MRIVKRILAIILLLSCIAIRSATAQLNNDLVLNQQQNFTESVNISSSESFIPSQIVKLRINIILLRNDDGEGGFDPDNPEHLDLIQSAVGWMNGSLIANGKMKDPKCYDTKPCFPARSAANYVYIPNTMIQFEIGKILTFDNSKYWDNKDCQDGEDDPINPNCPGDSLRYRCPSDEYSGNWYLNKLSQQINRDPNILPAINVFYSEDGEEFESYVVNRSCADPADKFHTQDCSERPSASLDKEQRVHMRSAFLKYSYLMNCKVCEPINGDCQYQGTPNECCSREKMLNNLKDGMSRSLMHELGHTLEFTSGHCNVCPTEELMNAGSPGKNLHSVEIENAHKNIQTTNLQRYVISEDRILINVINQTWNNFINLHKDYSLLNKKRLDLNNETHLLKDKKFIIENGSMIIHESALFELEDKAEIIVKKGSSLVIESGGVLKLLGRSKLIVECGATFTVALGGKVINMGSSDNINLACNKIIGNEVLGNNEANYILESEIPNGKIEWTVFPLNKVIVSSNGNGIKLSPLRGAKGSILLKATADDLFKMTPVSKIIWVGQQEPMSMSVNVIARTILQQIAIIYNHLGLIGSPLSIEDTR